MQSGLIVGQIVADYGLQVFFFPLSGNIHFHLVEDFVCKVASMFCILSTSTRTSNHQKTIMM